VSLEPPDSSGASPEDEDGRKASAGTVPQDKRRSKMAARCLDADADEAAERAAARSQSSLAAAPVGASQGLWADVCRANEEVIYDEDALGVESDDDSDDEEDDGEGDEVCKEGAAVSSGPDAVTDPAANAEAILACFSFVARSQAGPASALRLTAAVIRDWFEAAPMRFRPESPDTTRDVKGCVSRWRTLAERGERLVTAARAAASAGSASEEASFLVDENYTGGTATAAASKNHPLSWNEAVTRGVPERILTHRIRCVPLVRLERLWQAWGDGSWRLTSSSPSTQYAAASSTRDGATAIAQLRAACAESGIFIGPAPDAASSSVSAGGGSELFGHVLEVLVKWVGVEYGLSTWEWIGDPLLHAAASRAESQGVPAEAPLDTLWKLYVASLEVGGVNLWDGLVPR
jgi:hypothetical protein